MCLKDSEIDVINISFYEKYILYLSKWLSWEVTSER